MTGIDMPQLMAQKSGQLGLVCHFEQNSPRHGDTPAGKCIGIHIVCIDGPETVRHLQPVGNTGQIPAGLGQVGIEGAILNSAIVC